MSLTVAVAALAGIKTGKELATDLYRHLTTTKDPEAAAKVSQIQTLLFELQNSLIELNNKNIELAGEIRILNEKFEYRSKLVRRDAYYEFSEPVQGYGKGPFCLNCTDLNGLPVGVAISDGCHFSCPQCGTSGWLEGRKSLNHGRIIPNPEPFNK